MPGIDWRFFNPGQDARFPSPGTDTRFPSPGTDIRFPFPGADTRLGWSELTLFRPGDNGFLLDFERPADLFTTKAGAPNVAANADPVGLVLDTRRRDLGLLLHEQAEILTAAWELFTGGGSAAMTENPAGVLNFTGDGTNAAWADKSFAATPGRFYALDLAVEQNAISVWLGTARGGTQHMTSVRNPGLHRLFFRATTATTWLRLTKSAANLTVVRDVKGRLLPGNHGRQAGTGQRFLWHSDGYVYGDAFDDFFRTDYSPAAEGNTLAVFVDTPPSVVDQHTFIGNYLSATNSRIHINLNAAGQVRFGVGTVIGNGLGDWRGQNRQVFALVEDGTTSRGYANGAEVYTGNIAATPDVPAIPLFVGALNNNNSLVSFPTNGKIRKAFAINRALSPDDIFRLDHIWRNAA